MQVKTVKCRHTNISSFHSRRAGWFQSSAWNTAQAPFIIHTGTQTNRQGSPTICLPAYTWQLNWILTFPVGITFPDGVVVHSYLFIYSYKETLKNAVCFSSITLEPSSLCVLLLALRCVSLVVCSRKRLAAPAVKV